MNVKIDQNKESNLNNREKIDWKERERDLWENNERSNTHIIGIPEEEKKDLGVEKIFKEQCSGGWGW